MSNALVCQKLIHRRAYVDRIIHHLFLLFLFFLHNVIDFLNVMFLLPLYYRNLLIVKALETITLKTALSALHEIPASWRSNFSSAHLGSLLASAAAATGHLRKAC